MTGAKECGYAIKHKILIHNPRASSSGSILWNDCYLSSVSTVPQNHGFVGFKSDKNCVAEFLRSLDERFFRQVSKTILI